VVFGFDQASQGRFLFAQLLDLVFVATSVIPATITGLLVDDVLTDRKLELLPRYLLLLVLIPLARSCSRLCSATSSNPARKTP
jgi:hypothetical protein